MAQTGLNDEKSGGQKTRWTVPLRLFLPLYIIPPTVTVYTIFLRKENSAHDVLFWLKNKQKIRRVQIYDWTSPPPPLQRQRVAGRRVGIKASRVLWPAPSRWSAAELGGTTAAMKGAVAALVLGIGRHPPPPNTWVYLSCFCYFW